MKNISVQASVLITKYMKICNTQKVVELLCSLGIQKTWQHIWWCVVYCGIVTLHIGITCEVGSTTWDHWSVTLSFWSEEVSNWLKDVCQHRASAIIWTPNSILRSYSLQQSVGRVNYVVSVHVQGLKSFSLHKMTDVECAPNRSCSKHCSWSRALNCGTRMSSKILYSHVSPQSQDQLFSSRVIRDLLHTWSDSAFEFWTSYHKMHSRKWHQAFEFRYRYRARHEFNHSNKL